MDFLLEMKINIFDNSYYYLQMDKLFAILKYCNCKLFLILEFF